MEKINDGRIIGNILLKFYKVEENLGEGSFGKVYIGSNIQTKKLYAIKLVSNNFNEFLLIGKKEFKKESFRIRSMYS